MPALCSSVLACCYFSLILSFHQKIRLPDPLYVSVSLRNLGVSCMFYCFLAFSFSFWAFQAYALERSWELKPWFLFGVLFLIHPWNVPPRSLCCLVYSRELKFAANVLLFPFFQLVDCCDGVPVCMELLTCLLRSASHATQLYWWRESHCSCHLCYWWLGNSISLSFKSNQILVCSDSIIPSGFLIPGDSFIFFRSSMLFFWCSGSPLHRHQVM